MKLDYPTVDYQIPDYASMSRDDAVKARRKAVLDLCQFGLSDTQIAKHAGMSQPNVSAIIRREKKAGWIEPPRKTGQELQREAGLRNRQFIWSNASTMSDAEMAEILGLSESTVRSTRIQGKLHRKKGKRSPYPELDWVKVGAPDKPKNIRGAEYWDEVRKRLTAPHNRQTDADLEFGVAFIAAGHREYPNMRLKG